MNTPTVASEKSMHDFCVRFFDAKKEPEPQPQPKAKAPSYRGPLWRDAMTPDEKAQYIAVRGGDEYLNLPREKPQMVAGRSTPKVYAGRRPAGDNR